MGINPEDLAENLFVANTPTLIRLNSFFDDTVPGKDQILIIYINPNVLLLIYELQFEDICLFFVWNT